MSTNKSKAVLVKSFIIDNVPQQRFFILIFNYTYLFSHYKTLILARGTHPAILFFTPDNMYICQFRDKQSNWLYHL